MNIPFEEKTHQLSNFSFKTKRTPEGVVEFWTKDVLQMAKAMGFIHSHDRKMQMLLVRIISQGKLSHFLKEDEETIAIDTFMRDMAFYKEAKKEIPNLDTETKAFLQSYADGFNEGIVIHKMPLEFKLFKIPPQKWAIE